MKDFEETRSKDQRGRRKELFQVDLVRNELSEDRMLLRRRTRAEAGPHEQQDQLEKSSHFEALVDQDLSDSS